MTWHLTSWTDSWLLPSQDAYISFWSYCGTLASLTILLNSLNEWMNESSWAHFYLLEKKILCNCVELLMFEWMNEWLNTYHNWCIVLAIIIELQNRSCELFCIILSSGRSLWVISATHICNNSIYHNCSRRKGRRVRDSGAFLSVWGWIWALNACTVQFSSPCI